MDIQRLRNLTTARLHTEMPHVYQDIEFLTGIPGIMTHQLPNALQALKPFLKNRVCDSRFFDDQFDLTHTGEINIEPMSESERIDYFDRYNSLSNLLFGKEIIEVSS